MAGRERKKSWRNGSGGKWTTRITWFEGSPGDIRLQIEDFERKENVYPETKEKADHAWQLFRSGSPPEGVKTPFVEELLKLYEHPKCLIEGPIDDD